MKRIIKFLLKIGLIIFAAYLLLSGSLVKCSNKKDEGESPVSSVTACAAEDLGIMPYAAGFDWANGTTSDTSFGELTLTESDGVYKGTKSVTVDSRLGYMKFTFPSIRGKFYISVKDTSPYGTDYAYYGFSTELKLNDKKNWKINTFSFRQDGVNNNGKPTYLAYYNGDTAPAAGTEVYLLTTLNLSGTSYMSLRLEITIGKGDLLYEVPIETERGSGVNYVELPDAFTEREESVIEESVIKASGDVPIAKYERYIYIRNHPVDEAYYIEIIPSESTNIDNVNFTFFAGLRPTEENPAIPFSEQGNYVNVAANSESSNAIIFTATEAGTMHLTLRIGYGASPLTPTEDTPAYKEGYEAGFNAGQSAGYDAGYKDGYAQAEKDFTEGNTVELDQRPIYNSRLELPSPLAENTNYNYFGNYTADKTENKVISIWNVPVDKDYFIQLRSDNQKVNFKYVNIEIYNPFNEKYYYFETLDNYKYINLYFTAEDFQNDYGFVPRIELRYRLDNGYGEPQLNFILNMKTGIGRAPINTYEAGYESGFEDGYESGYQKGFDEGYKSGFGEGKKEGIEEGFASGKEEGKKEGYEVGRQEGYEAGYTEAVNSDINASGLFYGAISFLKIFFSLATKFLETKIAGDISLGLIIIGIPAVFTIANMAMNLVKKLLGIGGGDE